MPTDKTALSGAAPGNFLQEVGPAMCAYCDFQDKDSAALLTHVMDKHREKITRPAAPVAVPAGPKCPSGPVKQCCDVCKRSRCECEISEDDYEYGEPVAKPITPAQKKLAEKLDAPPLPPPQGPQDAKEYPHLLICSGDRRVPAGTPGHSCCCLNVTRALAGETRTEAQDFTIQVDINGTLKIWPPRNWSPDEFAQYITKAIFDAAAAASRIAQLEALIDAANQRFTFYGVSAEEDLETGIDNVYVKGTETAEAALTQAQQERDEAKKDAGWKHEFEMYRNAWIRELGGWLVPKSHEIDSLVLTTRKRCVNPLLGNCSEPHWMGKPTSDGKALQQTPHPRDNDCRDWKVDDSEPNPKADALRAEVTALMEAIEPLASASKFMVDTITDDKSLGGWGITAGHSRKALRVYEQVKEKI